MLKNTRLITFFFLVILLFMAGIPSGSGLATNSTEWPYGGEPEYPIKWYYGDEPDYPIKWFYGDEPDSTRSGLSPVRKGFPYNTLHLFNSVTFSDTVNFSWAQFNEKAYFSNAHFNEQADFSWAKFNEKAYFSKAQFNDQADFSDAQFNNEADFSGTDFNDQADFSDAQFNDQADFPRGTFENEASFSQVTFEDRASFYLTLFFNLADFSEAQFNDQADFFNTWFSNLADFSWAKFNEKAYFSNAQFNDQADFSDAQLNDQARFSHTRFSNLADFSGAEFGDMAFFNSVRFADRANFFNTRFSKKITLENAVFDSSIIFASTRFEKGIDLRRTTFSKAKIFIDHRTSFPPGKLNVNWNQLRGRIIVYDWTCRGYRERNSARNRYLLLDSLRKNPSKDLIGKKDSINAEYDKVTTKLDSLNHILDKERYDLTEIFYHRLRDNYLTQNNRSSADGVMYELASKRKDYLQEPLWKLYGLFMGWGYKPLRFVVTVFILVILPFSIIWYTRFYHRVLPLVAHLNEEQKKQLSNDDLLQEKTFLKIFTSTNYHHREAKKVANLFARLWHVVYFSSSVLISIRFKKDWIAMEDRAFLTWVTVEWALGIGLYITFAILVKSYEFGYVKGLLGF